MTMCASGKSSTCRHGHPTTEHARPAGAITLFQHWGEHYVSRRGRFPGVSDPDSAPPPPFRSRIVLQQGEEGAVALLYPADANAFATPVAVVALDAYQELPRIPVGDLIELDGPPRPGRKVTLRCADGSTISPSSPLRPPGDHSMRLFAERGPAVLVHPDVMGTSPSWRHAPTVSGSSVAAWERLLLRRHHEGVVSLVVGIALFVIGAAFLVAGGRGRATAVGVGLFIAGVAGTLQAKHSLHALRTARQVRAASPKRMKVRLWWSTGRGSGPAAMASLAPLASSDPAREAVHLEVVNVPPRLSSGEWTEGEVRGDPGEGGCPIVRVGDAELWPVNEGTRVLRRAWWHDWANR